MSAQVFETQISVRGPLRGLSLKCFLRTFHDLLSVVGEELAEGRPLGPLQGVEQLLDLSRHSAVHRNS